MRFITTTKVTSPKRMGSGNLPETPICINADRIEYFEPVQPGAAEHHEDGTVSVLLSSGATLYLKENMTSLTEKIDGTGLDFAAGS